MTTSNDGLTKLIEGCGEVIQVAAKKIAFMHTDDHPDGAGSIKARMEDELADLLAAVLFVTESFALDESRMSERAEKKYELFTTWHKNQKS